MDPEPQRVRDATRARLLAAAEGLVVAGGASALGVNALARAAECDKQLVYRYFGGLDGVLAALGQRVAERMAVVLAASGSDPAPDWPAFGRTLVRGLTAAYRADPVLAALRAAELASPPKASPLGDIPPLVQARAVALTPWLAQVRPRTPPPAGCDVPACVAVLTGAVESVALSAASPGAPAGLRLCNTVGRTRVDATLDRLATVAFSPGA